MELSETMKRGRPKSRFMDAVREDMAVDEVTEEEIGPKKMENPLLRPLTGVLLLAERRTIIHTQSHTHTLGIFQPKDEEKLYDLPVTHCWLHCWPVRMEVRPGSLRQGSRSVRRGTQGC